MAKPESEFHVPTAPWESIGVEGIDQQIVSFDEATGAYTRLLRFGPNTNSQAMGVQGHEFWEEIFILDGDLTDLRLGETFSKGMYACRPPGMKHGPWSSTHGCLLIEFRYGFAT